MEMIIVPLNRLTVSELNVRKIGAKDIADLKANIRENGLISRLLSVVATEREGHYAVIAGGRRFRALKELAGQRAVKAPLTATRIGFATAAPVPF